MVLTWVLAGVAGVLTGYSVRCHKAMRNLRYNLSESQSKQKELIKDLNYTESACKICREDKQHFYDVCRDGWKNLQIKDLYSRVEVAGVSNDDFRIWVTIKIFEYDVNDEDDHAFALREAEELVEFIEKG